MKKKKATKQSKKVKLTEDQMQQLFIGRMGKLADREGYTLEPTLSIMRFKFLSFLIKHLLRITKSILHNRVVKIK